MLAMALVHAPLVALVHAPLAYGSLGQSASLGAAFNRWVAANSTGRVNPLAVPAAPRR